MKMSKHLAAARANFVRAMERLDTNYDSVGERMPAKGTLARQAWDERRKSYAALRDAWFALDSALASTSIDAAPPTKKLKRRAAA